MTDENQSVPAAARAVSPANSLGIPVAIVIAAALIAGAIMFTGMQKSTVTTPSTAILGQKEQVTPELAIPPVTKEDHIQGNPKAPIMIVEYSDYDCPFCKRFHDTMNVLMSEYGKDGKIAWAYRHSPLPMHPNAPKIAEAAECVADLGGNDAFWKFSDSVFSRDIQTSTDMLKLPTYAEQAGVSKAKYTECVQSGKFTQAVTDALASAQKAGVGGTPYSIIMSGDQKIVINGAEPIEMVKQKLAPLFAQ